MLTTRWRDLGARLALLAAYAVVVGSLSVISNVQDAAHGDQLAIIRLMLGLWGLVSGILLWTGSRTGIGGWNAIVIWAVLQIPYVSWNFHGSPTTQFFDFPLSYSTILIENSVVTAHRAFGINFVGVLLLFWAGNVRDRWERRAPLKKAVVTGYEILLRAPDQAQRTLGTHGDPESARRSASNQAAELRDRSEPGEVIVIERPSGQLVAREALG